MKRCFSVRTSKKKEQNERGRVKGKQRQRQQKKTQKNERSKFGMTYDLPVAYNLHILQETNFRRKNGLRGFVALILRMVERAPRHDGRNGRRKMVVKVFKKKKNENTTMSCAHERAQLGPLTKETVIGVMKM